MNVKAVVKVMNFHALLRVDASRKRAEKLLDMEEELESMMRIVLGNRNLRLDKRIRLPDQSLPPLRIYLGSDFGFCGSVNATVSSVLRQDDGAEKVVVGKKLRRGAEASLFLTQEQFEQNFGEVRGYLERAVKERCWSGVDLIYNHYYNISSIKQIERRIYPMEPLPEEASEPGADFMIEGDAESMINDMTVSYLIYELKIAAASAYAAENVMRQNATSESLKKLDEIEEEETRQIRKEKNAASFQKTIDSYVKQKAIGGQ
ncbi:MAG: F0F1 ATP synthase subunit gamma [Oscillospiraceae bacterium]|nr:F0F1 ATP synthase subunit gamma [Oscillospiraceae bacterium]